MKANGAAIQTRLLHFLRGSDKEVGKSMNKVEFMRQLESLLQNISEQERQEALHYYDDYFDDAGPENEQAVLEALGNPARVAENIRRDLYGAGYGDGYVARKPVTGRELTEYGTVVEEEQRQEDAGHNAAMRGFAGMAGERETPRASATTTGTWQGNAQPRPMGYGSGQGGQGSSGKAAREPMPAWLIVLIVFLCIFLLPVAGGLIGVGAGVLGVVLGIIAAWFAMILGFGVAALICLAVGIFISVVGMVSIGFHPLAGLGLIGGGFITVGIGVLFMMLTVAMAGCVTPAIFRGIARLFSGKKKRA